MIDYRCLLSSSSNLFRIKSINKIGLIIKALVRLIFWKATNLTVALTSRDILIVSSYHRNDLINDVEYWKKNSRLDLLHIHISPFDTIELYKPKYINLKKAIYLVREIHKHLEFDPSFLGNVFLYIRALEAQKFAEIIMSQNSLIKTEIIISHMESHFYENILLQCANSLDIKTLALQHGFYSFDGIKVSKYSVNSVNYLSSVCFIFLAWGEQSIKEIGLYISSQIKIVGKTNTLVKSFDTQYCDHDKVLVILGNPVHRPLNVLLIECLKYAGYKKENVVIKHHPTDDYFYQHNYSSQFVDDFCPGLVIGLHSSLLIQYGIAGYPLVLYRGSKLLNGISKKMTLKPYKKLGKIGELGFVTDIPQKYWNSFIGYHSTEAVDRLDSLIESLNKN
jgi:hypothetical protein